MVYFSEDPGNPGIKRPRPSRISRSDCRLIASLDVYLFAVSMRESRRRKTADNSSRVARRRDGRNDVRVNIAIKKTTKERRVTLRTDTFSGGDPFLRPDPLRFLVSPPRFPLRNRRRSNQLPGHDDAIREKIGRDRLSVATICLSPSPSLSYVSCATIGTIVRESQK